LPTCRAGTRAPGLAERAVILPRPSVQLQFTSGTWHAKGATLTHLSIVTNGLFVGRHAPDRDDRVCIRCAISLLRNGLGVLAAMTHGAASIFPSEAFDPLAVLAAVTNELLRVARVPTMFIASSSTSLP